MRGGAGPDGATVDSEGGLWEAQGQEHVHAMPPRPHAHALHAHITRARVCARKGDLVCVGSVMLVLELRRGLDWWRAACEADEKERGMVRTTYACGKAVLPLIIAFGLLLLACVRAGPLLSGACPFAHGRALLLLLAVGQDVFIIATFHASDAFPLS